MRRDGRAEERGGRGGVLPGRRGREEDEQREEQEPRRRRGELQEATAAWWRVVVGARHLVGRGPPRRSGRGVATLSWGLFVLRAFEEPH